LAAYGGESGFDMHPDAMAVDEIFAHNNERINHLMNEVWENIKANATDFFYNKVVDLSSMANALEMKKEKDLQWLLQKTIVYDDPLGKEYEELKRICI